MFQWLRNITGGGEAYHLPRSPGRPARAKLIRARFDAAATNDENRRHWQNADGLSANAAASPEVRRILRNRARYEVANNSYARGIVQTLANDVVGTGPRLQMLTEDAAANGLVEAEFTRWAKAVNLAEKLRTLRVAQAESGEGFAILALNDALASPVKIDLRLVEADQVTTPNRALASLTDDTDGIVFDAFGNPVEYHVLRHHPGSLVAGFALEFDRIPARNMLHLYRPDRPGQNRGIPDITPALPLFAQLRRYTLAVIAAAETAADFAAVLFTDAPAAGEAAEVEPMDVVELERRMATVLPGGWKLGQVHAEQPATTYGEFKREILNEIARCLNMPFNVAAGNSSGYNYASGRLDHQTYFKSIRVDQARMEAVLLDRLFDAWMREAVLVEGLLPQFLRKLDAAYPHQWFWDGQEHVDPAKEATAQATRLSNHTTTLAYEYARQGRDWEAELRQRAKEQALMKELGLTPPPESSAQPLTQPTPGVDHSEQDGDQADEPATQE